MPVNGVKSEACTSRRTKASSSKSTIFRRSPSLRSLVGGKEPYQPEICLRNHANALTVGEQLGKLAKLGDVVGGQIRAFDGREVEDVIPGDASTGSQTDQAHEVCLR